MEDRSAAQPEPSGFDPRYAIDLPARLIVSEGAPEPCRLINLSRGGFRVACAQVFPAGQPVRLEVDGWPRLHGRVIWCDHGRIGCCVEDPPSDAVYAMMRGFAGGRDRDPL